MKKYKGRRDIETVSSKIRLVDIIEIDHRKKLIKIR